MTTPARITRRPAPLHEQIGMNAFDIIAGDVFVLQWQAAREDIAGCEVLLEYVLQDTGWAVAGPLLATGEASWAVDLVPRDVPA